MVPLLFIIIVSCHSTRPCGFLYMYLHQHGIPILSSSDPLLVRALPLVLAARPAVALTVSLEVICECKEQNLEVQVAY